MQVTRWTCGRWVRCYSKYFMARYVGEEEVAVVVKVVVKVKVVVNVIARF